MTHRFRVVPLFVFAVILAAAPAFAVDGVILIDQNRALAGGVTPGDSPGFPVVITTSGSFRLSGNLVVSDVNTTAISITTGASAVTIDLNGFSIVGPVTCSISPTVCDSAADDPGDIFGSGVGIRSQVRDSLTVKNGSIVGMGRYALFQLGGPQVIIDSVHAKENGLGGLWPSSGLVINSVATINGGIGITSNAGVIKNSVVTRNAGDGIASTGLPLNIQDCQIYSNGGFGIDFASSGGLIGSNLIHGNLGGAIDGSPVVGSQNYCVGSGCP